jgi:hypothetical protein
MVSQGTFTIYDIGYATTTPDTSTSARAAAVTLENAIRGNALETGAFLASSGSVIVQKTGAPDNVKFVGAELNGTRGTLFTHNHPDDSSFSLPDVISAIRSDLEELRAVGPTIRHFMQPAGPWPTEAALLNALPSAAVMARRKVAHAVGSGALNSRHAQAEITHQLWVELAALLGFSYWREKS